MMTKQARVYRANWVRPITIGQVESIVSWVHAQSRAELVQPIGCSGRQ